MNRQTLLLLAAGLVVLMGFGLAAAIFPPKVTYSHDPSYDTRMAAYEACYRRRHPNAVYVPAFSGSGECQPPGTIKGTQQVTMDRALIVGAGVLVALVLVGLGTREPSDSSLKAN